MNMKLVAVDLSVPGTQKVITGRCNRLVFHKWIEIPGGNTGVTYNGNDNPISGSALHIRIGGLGNPPILFAASDYYARAFAGEFEDFYVTPEVLPLPTNTGQPYKVYFLVGRDFDLTFFGASGGTLPNSPPVVTNQ